MKYVFVLQVQRASHSATYQGSGQFGFVRCCCRKCHRELRPRFVRFGVFECFPTQVKLMKRLRKLDPETLLSINVEQAPSRAKTRKGLRNIHHKTDQKSPEVNGVRPHGVWVNEFSLEITGIRQQNGVCVCVIILTQTRFQLLVL